MKVLGHDHVTQHDELIAAPHLLENGEKQITTARSAEQRFTPITTTGDKVQIVVEEVTSRVNRNVR
jgi:hypothetical protein